MDYQLVSASSVMLIHDLQAGGDHYDIAPQTVLDHHSMGARINSVAWSHNNMIVASGADDGQIILSQAATGQKLQSFNAYQSKTIPISGGVKFSKHSEFLATGLGDGIVKLWDLKRKIQLRTFRSNTPQTLLHSQVNTVTSPVTGISFNKENSLIAASNAKGCISLYPMQDLIEQGKQATPTTNYVPEITQIRSSDSCINDLQFSFLDRNLFTTGQDNSLVTLYDQTTCQQTHQFNGHKSSVKGVAFSPLNKLLLSSVGLDKNIVFYDTNDKIIVKRIKTDLPLQSVSFCSDGHTIAIGASNMGAVLIYDLRKSSKEVYKVCTGHKHTINSLQFSNKVSSKSSNTATASKDIKAPTSKVDPRNDKAPGSYKTMEQIRQEAKKLAEKKKQENLAKIEEEQRARKESLKRKGDQKKPQMSSLQLQKLPQGLEQLDQLQSSRMQQKQMTEDQREEVIALVEEKFTDFQSEVQAMMNNFQIEIIRQFEIQQTQLQNLAQEYLVDSDDELQPQLEKQPNEYDFSGEDMLFYQKYGEQQESEEGDSFDNGYYF